ncbi:MAG: peptidoglycan-binding protein [Candidatus Omnitrophica bacterium]|nr:peptidoglycan-binding protein [Candidatus Omnitrophota bacterium]
MGISTAFARSQAEVLAELGVSPVEVQKALTEAGDYQGPVDGIIGRKTRQAIRAFQEKNGVKADGVCGAQTWEKLKSYLAEAKDMDLEQSTAPSSLEPSSVSSSDDDFDYDDYYDTEPSDENSDLKQKLVA